MTSFHDAPDECAEDASDFTPTIHMTDDDRFNLNLNLFHYKNSVRTV